MVGIKFLSNYSLLSHSSPGLYSESFAKGIETLCGMLIAECLVVNSHSVAQVASMLWRFK